MAATVDPVKCDQCGTCIAICPADALLLKTDALAVDKSLCTNCGACVKICPFGAMTLSRENETKAKGGRP